VQATRRDDDQLGIGSDAQRLDQRTSESADHLTGVRAERAAVRSLSFLARDISIELEVTSDALLGQLVPARSGTIEVQTREGTTHTAAADENGWFTIRPLPGAMFRLHLRTATDNVITEWITL
jgi:hypothetical protein